MKRLLVFGVILLSASIAPSQVTRPPTPKEQKLLTQRLRAVSMVVQTANEAMAWDDKKNAAGTLADAADLMWPEVPASAAKWLIKAWSDTDEIPASMINERLKELSVRSEKSDMRARVLRVASKYDPKLADKFIKQLAEEKPEEKKNRGVFDNRSARSEQLLRLADQVASTDPDLAFNLAASSLIDGVSQTLQSVLTNLRANRTDLADRLYDLALSRFTNSAGDPSEGEVLAGYLFSPGLTFSVDSSGRVIFAANPSQRSLPAPATSDPKRARNFLVAAYQSFFGRPIASETPEDRLYAQRVLAFGSRIAGRYATLAPEFSGPLQTFLAQLKSQLYPDAALNQASSKKDSNTKPRTRDEMYEDYLTELEAAADNENDPSAKRLAYIKAALATKPEDYERAKRITEKIGDDNVRIEAGSFVLYRAGLFFIGKGDLEKAAQLVPRIDGSARQAVVKIGIARALLVANVGQNPNADQASVRLQRAFELLASVDSDLRKQELSAESVKIALGKTAVVVNLDKTQLQTSLTQVVQMINKLERFDLRDASAPNLGLTVPGAPPTVVEAPRVGFDLRSVLEPVIADDFDEISDIVEGFASKEVRAVGRFEVAKWFLMKNPPVKAAGVRAEH